MKKQLGLITSLIAILVTALCWTGCSHNRGYYNYDNNCCDGAYQAPCEPVCQPKCPPPCPPKCPPRCEPMCPPKCPPPCPPRCEPVCPPKCPPPCPPPCPPRCEPVCPPKCPPPCPPPCPPRCEPVCPPKCPPPCPPPCAPCPPPVVCPPEPCCPAPIQCKFPPNNEICTDGVIVSVSQPKLCILGDNYAMDLCIKACTAVCHVEVNAMLPDDVTLVRSEPEGVQQHGQTLTWMFDGMDKGEVRHSRVLLRADREGDLCVCFCVTAVPVQFCSVLCAKPVLECSKTGPCEVCPGDPVHYTITVSNRGSCPAEEVVLVDNVPPELEHESGQRKLVWKLGTLGPCETKTVNACFTAVKRGKACNTINVSACNANPSSCQFCTNICKVCIELTKVGPKERKVGETADYEITVTNPGDKPLTNVILVDQAPTGTSIVEARGAQVNGNQAIWRWDELKPGERQTVILTLTTCTPGYYVNRVSVDNCQGCRQSAEWGTRWRGTPSLNMCFDEAEGPICIGDYNSYTLRVTNQGQEEDTNVQVVIRFPSQLTPVSADGGPVQIQGQNVVYAPIQRLAPRQTVEFTVEAQAKEKGDARTSAEVKSDTIKTPIIQQESTIIN